MFIIYWIILYRHYVIYDKFYNIVNHRSTKLHQTNIKYDKHVIMSITH
jgi:hypothetical protein